MSHYAVWLDHQYAYIYEFGLNGVDELTLKASSYGDHIEKFYHSVAEKLPNAEELVLMGPGTAKEQFKHHCEKHHHAQLAKAIIAVKPMEAHPTKAMMLHEARELFKEHHLWTKNY